MEEKALKKCCKCGRELPLESFNKCKVQHDGLQSHCRECHSDYNKKSYAQRKTLGVKHQEVTPMHKVYAHAELAKFTPRQLMEELKARGFRWEYILEPQRKIMFEKI